MQTIVSVLLTLIMFQNLVLFTGTTCSKPVVKPAFELVLISDLKPEDVIASLYNQIAPTNVQITSTKARMLMHKNGLNKPFLKIGRKKIDIMFYYNQEGYLIDVGYFNLMYGDGRGQEILTSFRQSCSSGYRKRALFAAKRTRELVRRGL